MITHNVLASKTNMGKYLRGGIVGLYVGPKEKKIRTLNVTTRLSLSQSKVNISAILFLKLSYSLKIYSAVFHVIIPLQVITKRRIPSKRIYHMSKTEAGQTIYLLFIT